jgi:hypothetical protein
MMVPHLLWARGGTAVITSVVDDAIELRSSTPAPPGARLEATLAADASILVKIKSHGSRRDDDAFVIKGRLIDCTRALRERLLGFTSSGR